MLDCVCVLQTACNPLLAASIPEGVLHVKQLDTPNYGLNKSFITADSKASSLSANLIARRQEVDSKLVLEALGVIEAAKEQRNNNCARNLALRGAVVNTPTCKPGRSKKFTAGKSPRTEIRASIQGQDTAGFPAGTLLPAKNDASMLQQGSLHMQNMLGNSLPYVWDKQSESVDPGGSSAVVSSSAGQRPLSATPTECSEVKTGALYSQGTFLSDRFCRKLSARHLEETWHVMDL